MNFSGPTNSLSYRYPLLCREHEWNQYHDKLNGCEERKQALDAMLPLLDGQHSIEEIYGKLLNQGFMAEIIFQTMETLDENHFLEEQKRSNSNGLTRAESQYYAEQIQQFRQWNHEYNSIDPTGTFTDGEEAQIKLKQSSVVVVGSRRIGKKLIESLAQAGVGTLVGISESRIFECDEIRTVNPYVNYYEIHDEKEMVDELRDQPASVMVYCPDQFDDDYCKSINSIALKTKTSLLIVRQNPTTFEIGPLVIPHETACYVCCDRRRKAAVPYYDSKNVRPGGALFNFPIGVGFLALEIIKLLTYCAEPITKGRLWRLNLLRGLSDVHPVLKLPRCPACGVHRFAPPSKLWEE